MIYGTHIGMSTTGRALCAQMNSAASESDGDVNVGDAAERAIAAISWSGLTDTVGSIASTGLYNMRCMMVNFKELVLL